MNTSGTLVIVKRPGVGPEMRDASLRPVFWRTVATSNIGEARGLCPCAWVTPRLATAESVSNTAFMSPPRPAISSHDCSGFQVPEAHGAPMIPRMFVPGSVQYGRPLARGYDEGRRLSSEAARVWRE